MKEKRVRLKLEAKRMMVASKGKATLASVAFVALILLMSILVTNLSGAARYMQNYTDAFLDAYEDVGELYEKSENGSMSIDDASEAAYAELSKAMDKALVWPTVKPAAIVLCCAVMLLSELLEAGYVSFCMIISRGEESSVKDIFNSFYATGKFIAIIIIKAVAVSIACVFLIFPGVMLLYRWRFAFHAAYDDPELSAIGCLKRSSELTKGHKWELFVLDLSFLGWRILGTAIKNIIIFPVTDIYAEPFAGTTVALWYNECIDYRKMPEEGEEE